MTWNISNFMSEFINQFFTIGSDILNKVDHIIIYGNISLLDFMITMLIISAFISIVITAPKLSLLNEKNQEHQRFLANEERRYDSYWESKR